MCVWCVCMYVVLFAWFANLIPYLSHIMNSSPVHWVSTLLYMGLGSFYSCSSCFMSLNYIWSLAINGVLIHQSSWLLYFYFVTSVTMHASWLAQKLAKWIRFKSTIQCWLNFAPLVKATTPGGGGQLWVGTVQLPLLFRKLFDRTSWGYWWLNIVFCRNSS